MGNTEGTLRGGSVVVNTTRFGQVDIKEEDILTFSEGLLGFGDLRRFVLLDDPSDEIFAWLQSCEAGAIAFPVLEPDIFAENYNVVLSKGDLEGLKLKDQKDAHYFSIITIPEDPTQMTANMKAPIAINLKARVARQCVLQDNNLAIREPIFKKLQQRVVMSPMVSIKEQLSGIDLTVRLNKRDPEAEM
jgi:flagellar assembly factor FliW